ncbi:hypothetical protein DFH28DRAFT_989886 [Melampsora americana]|nr:hypothetical protein DFH28DRAFT_989886 [Melampsora americana]
MSNSGVDDVMRLLGEIPASANPFVVIADFLKRSIQPFPIPRWAQWVQRCIFIGFFLMCCQSCRLIYVRIKTKSFRSFSINQLGLVRIDLLSICAVGYFVYSLHSYDGGHDIR